MKSCTYHRSMKQSFSYHLGFIIYLFSGLFSCGLLAQESANFGEAKFAPPDGKKLLIMGQDLGSVGGLASYSNGYVDAFGSHVPAGVTTYTSIPSLSGLTTVANWGAGDVHAQVYLTDPTFDHTVIAIGLYLVGQLDAIRTGTHDAAIRNLANWIKSANRPVFLRIGYEFDGSWNGYNPTEFIDAWRYIVHVFDQEAVRNVAYVWQSAGINTPNLASWYPGDTYVNWVGYSHFDGPNPGSAMRAFAQTHDKPIMIAEAAPRVELDQGDAPSHWNSWFAPLFATIYQHDRIKAFAYINADWENQPMWTGEGWGDSRVQTVPFLKQAWEQEVLKQAWWHASPALFDSLQYDAWIAGSTSATPPIEREWVKLKKQGDKISILSPHNIPIQKIEVLTLLGQLLWKQEGIMGETQIHLDSLPAGPIWVRVEGEGNRHTSKVFYP